MYISFDNGAHWQPFALNMPRVPINDIRVHRKNLIVATQGRALWILDNVTPLHQLTTLAGAGEFTVFRTRPGYRTRTALELIGPMVDYYLPTSPAGVVKVEILDAAGSTVVNTYSSDRPPPAARGRGGDDDEDAGPGFGRFFASRVTGTAGMNRFVWDLRSSDGITSPPGEYQVRVTASGISKTQPLTVLLDPRVAAEGTTVADLKEQYDHNLRMRRLVADANRTVGRVQQFLSRARGASGALADTLARVQVVAGKLLSEPVRYGKPGLQAHIGYLAGMTANTDQKVGRDALLRYEVLRKELEALKVELDHALGPEPERSP
jgi:hypothetical protein